MRQADTLAALEEFRRFTRESADFKVEKQGLSDQDEWIVEDGSLKHKTKGFFDICGFRHPDSDQEELVLYQPQGAFNGLLIHKDSDGTIWVMIQARFEPGNVDWCQYGPTIQSTPANYLRNHGGKATPYMDYFFSYRPDSHPIHNSTQLDLGHRYYQKTKILRYVQVDTMVDTAENMIWVKLNALHEYAQRDQVLNTDLRSMLAVFDWNGFVQFDQFNPGFTQLPEQSSQGFKPGTLVPLEELEDWTVSNNGIHSKYRDASVQLFRISCTNREVKSWVQPLFRSSWIGQYDLLVRNQGGTKEVLIQNTQEQGITGGNVVQTSFYSYNGPTEFELEGQDEVLSSIMQSEEGGRFYRNENRYRIIRVNRDIQTDDSQQWLSIEQFKALLQSSNRCSIQLRAISSLIIGIMNPGLTANVRLNSSAQ